jgi:hypothetical protein
LVDILLVNSHRGSLFRLLTPHHWRYHLQDLPVYVGGVSSGAAFALRLPSEMPGELSGVVSEVLAIPTPYEQTYDVSGGG